MKTSGLTLLNHYPWLFPPAHTHWSSFLHQENTRSFLTPRSFFYNLRREDSPLSCFHSTSIFSTFPLESIFSINLMHQDNDTSRETVLACIVLMKFDRGPSPYCPVSVPLYRRPHSRNFTTTPALLYRSWYDIFSLSLCSTIRCDHAWERCLNLKRWHWRFMQKEMKHRTCSTLLQNRAIIIYTPRMILWTIWYKNTHKLDMKSRLG